jgi:hypothetical protein
MGWRGVAPTHQPASGSRRQLPHARRKTAANPCLCVCKKVRTAESTPGCPPPPGEGLTSASSLYSMSISSSVSMCSLTKEMGTASRDLQPDAPRELRD